jgi:hypothetical protein
LLRWMKGTNGNDMIRCGDLWEGAGMLEISKKAWTRALDFRGSESEANARLARFRDSEEE